tara:strand:+ start:41 stop:1603 length:1563 start_codon:yes stop_codon:yes gene_type:complete
MIILLLCPIISIFLASLEFNFSIWNHLISTKLSIYISNTLILLLGVGCTSLLIGLSTAWIIAKNDFPFSKIIEWALILPLAIPAYIVAYCYTDFLEYSGPIQTLLRNIFNFQSSKDYVFPEIRSMGGAIFVMSFVLYPYIYLISKISFLSTPISLYELAKIHGKSTFFHAGLPMARPAIVAGLSLVLMETISDFGTVEFFAVETLTLGIFNLWLGMNDFAAASQVALFSFTFVFVLLGVELSARKRKQFYDTQIKSIKYLKNNLNKFQSFLAIIFCLIPIFFGFLIPVLILIEQCSSKLNEQNFLSLFEIATNTLIIATVSALIIVIISTFLAITTKYKTDKNFKYFATAAGVGYAFPGVMLALGTTYFFSSMQSFEFFNETNLIGTFVALIFAYVSRFNAIGYGAINAGILRVPNNLMDASLTLGYSFEKSLLKIIFPILKPSLLIAGILSFVDIAKELPVTLILRPFDFETLSTYVYQYAKDEMFEDSAFAALLIVIIGLIPIFILNKYVKPEKFLSN